LYSTSLITILSLITFISKVFQFLKIVKTTGVHFGHLIQETASFKEVFLVISFQSAFKIISHHFNPAFSEGEPDIGETIFNTQGFSIST
jgi:hypothetical protein